MTIHLKLKQIAKYRRGSFPQPYGNSEWYDGEGSMPFVQVADVEEDSMRLKEATKQKISKLAMPKSVFAPKGTVIVTLQGSIGKVAITQYDSYVDRTLGLFENYLIDIDKKYFALQLEKIFSIKRKKARGGTIKTITKEEFSEFQIPIPSLSEQNRIVGILDTFTASIDNLKEQIAQRRKQYEYYRDQLLDLEGKEGVEMKTLGEISTFSQGIQVPLENQSLANKEGYFRFLRIIDFTQGNEPPRYVPISDKRYWISSDEIAIVRYGTPGFVCRGLEGILANNMFKVIIKDKGLLGNSFLSSLLKSKIFQTPIKQKSSGGALQAISFGLIKDISVPVPPLQEQQRIVSILDTFEASTQNLEAQLKAREKQYEYYRNKLLTFE